MTHYKVISPFKDGLGKLIKSGTWPPPNQDMADKLVAAGCLQELSGDALAKAVKAARAAAVRDVLKAATAAKAESDQMLEITEAELVEDFAEAETLDDVELSRTGWIKDVAEALEEVLAEQAADAKVAAEGGDDSQEPAPEPTGDDTTKDAPGDDGAETTPPVASDGAPTAPDSESPAGDPPPSSESTESSAPALPAPEAEPAKTGGGSATPKGKGKGKGKKK